MRIIAILFFIFSTICSLLAPAVFAGAPGNVKYSQSVYQGANEIGLNHPAGVACTDSYFIVADTGNNRLLKYEYSNSQATLEKLEIPIINPLVAQLNSAGKIYAIDGRDLRVAIFNPDGKPAGYLAPKGLPAGRKMIAKSLMIDQQDRINILDIGNAKVVILDSNGVYSRQLPFPEGAGFLSDLAVDRFGAIYLVDSTEAAVYKAAADAEQFSLLSSGEIRDYANFPTNIAVDDQGFIYLVDKHGGNLVLLNPDGSFLTHKFGYGWKASQFYYPSQICISKSGNLIIADSGNSRIELFFAND